MVRICDMRAVGRKKSSFNIWYAIYIVNSIICIKDVHVHVDRNAPRSRYTHLEICWIFLVTFRTCASRLSGTFKFATSSAVTAVPTNIQLSNYTSQANLIILQYVAPMTRHEWYEYNPDRLMSELDVDTLGMWRREAHGVQFKFTFYVFCVLLFFVYSDPHFTYTHEHTKQIHRQIDTEYSIIERSTVVVLRPPRPLRH